MREDRDAVRVDAVRTFVEPGSWRSRRSLRPATDPSRWTETSDGADATAAGSDQLPDSEQFENFEPRHRSLASGSSSRQNGPSSEYHLG